MKRIFSLLVVVSLVGDVAAIAAVRGKAAKYVGGTIAALPEKTEGKLDLQEAVVVFVVKNDTKLAIPYAKIESLEYGQKAGRRVGVALAVSPLFLFSKKRKHFLTIGFLDEAGKKQGAVFEVAKGVVRETLSTLETKSGKNVEYESQEAKKHAQKR